MTRRVSLRSQAGTTLVELLIAVGVLAVILGAALGFLRGQGAGFAEGTERMDLFQNARYGIDLMAREMRVTGSGVPEVQPFLVYGDTMTVAFNANLISNVANDVAAIYIDVDAPTGAVSSMRKTDRAKLPQTSFFYPDSTYKDTAGIESPAETVIFYFVKDSTTSRTDDYQLMRQVNRQAAELVARNILRTSGAQFIEYVRQGPANSGRIQSIPKSQLPLRHTVPIHESVADTGAVARIDSVRGIRIRYTATDGESGVEERRRSVARLVMLHNAGRAVRTACGDTPLLGVTLVATLQVQPDTSAAVELRWGPAIDQNAGEKDVVRYVVWKRITGQAWDDPFLSIPGGQALYTYVDHAVVSGTSYEYSLAAQDCTPKLSTRTTAGPLVIP